MIPNEKYKTLFKPLNKIEVPKPSPAQFKAGIPLKTNDSIESSDLIEALCSVKPAAQVLFVELKRNYSSELGVVAYPINDAISDVRSNTYKVFSRRIMELKNAKILVGLPKKIERGIGLKDGPRYYLINPAYIKCLKYSEAKSLWLHLTQ